MHAGNLKGQNALSNPAGEQVVNGDVSNIVIPIVSTANDGGNMEGSFQLGSNHGSGNNYSQLYQASVEPVHGGGSAGSHSFDLSVQQGTILNIGGIDTSNATALSRSAGPPAAFQLQFNPGGSAGHGSLSATSISSPPLLSNGSLTTANNNAKQQHQQSQSLTSTDSFVSGMGQSGGMLHQQPHLMSIPNGVSQGGLQMSHHSDMMLPRTNLLSSQQQQQMMQPGQSLPSLGGQQPWMQSQSGILNGQQQSPQLLTLQQPMLSSMGTYQPQLQGLIPQQQQHQQQQQQSSSSFAGTKFPTKPWHSGDHTQIRATMVEEIIKLLKTRRPNATEDWHEKLPHMAKRLEDALYHEAPLMEEYSDHSTLKQRLQQLALSMGGNNSKPATSSGKAPSDRQQQRLIQQQHQQQQQMLLQQQNGPPQQFASQQHQFNQQFAQQHMQQQQQFHQMQQNPGNNNSGALQNFVGSQQHPYSTLPPQQLLPTFSSGVQQHRQNNPAGTSSIHQQSGQQQYSGNGGQSQPALSGALNYPANGDFQHSQQPQLMPSMQVHHQQSLMPLQQHLSTGGAQMPFSGGNLMMGASNGSTEGEGAAGMYLAHNQQQPRLYGSNGGGANNVPLMMGNAAQQPQLQPLHPNGSYIMQQGTPDEGSLNGSLASYSVGHSQQQQQGLANRASALQMPNSHPSQNPQQQMHLQNPQLLQQQQMQQHAMQQQQLASGQPQQQPVPNIQHQQSVHQAGGTGGPQHSDEHRKQVLKQQQQRLLLLRHASKCPHDNGRCPVTPHCWSMKVLWKHIMSCKDQECKVPHCVSSRYVLSHYSKCKEQTCPVCGPVREAIKRNYERSRDVVKMARNPHPQPGYMGHPGSAQQPQNQIVPGREDQQPPAKKAKTEKKSKSTDNGNQVLTLPQPAAPPKLVIRQKSIYPLDPISSAIYSFTAEQIASHFKNIQEGMKLTVAKIKEMCRPIMDDLLKIPHAYGVFGTAVDPVALNLPDYLEVIKYPMDLGTVLKRLESGSYRDMHNFVSDVHLTFDNAMAYNPKNSDVYLLAKSLKKDFDGRYRLKVAEFEKAIEDSRVSPDSCLICGEVSLKFEPPVYYCNGTCAQRIRRNAVFYSNATNTYHWCSACFNAMKENETVRLPDCTITRLELFRNKKKHTEESEEGWVQCEGGCSRWVHQVCSLFNARRNISDDVSYVCPVCIQEKRRKHPEQVIVAPTTKKMRAVDLPVSTLSEFLERRIFERLQIAYEEDAAKRGLDVSEVEKCPSLILRQVSCLDKLHSVREGVYNRYKDKGYPTDFPCRTKCLVLFQNIDGQDVILFGMYVYEYGHKCPQPNQRRVYISYLDSVHYLRPKQYRTMVYHEILVSYLDYVKARGFHTAHIWACPPQKGDDYILYVHPSDQKTPKPQILRVWYDEMLKLSKERGIVHEITDIHSEYLLDPALDATVLPYFEGDYWVNEAEVIIKDLGEGGDDDDDAVDGSVVGKKSKRKSKVKRPTRTSSKPLVGKSDRDPVMAKLANIIEPMKDTFFVARLHPREYAEKFAELRKAEINAEASENTTESNDLREKKLQEEALSGTDVNMPAIPVEVKKEQQQSLDEEEDDFGKAAGAVQSGYDEETQPVNAEDEMIMSMAAMDEQEAAAAHRAQSFEAKQVQQGASTVVKEEMHSDMVVDSNPQLQRSLTEYVVANKNATPLSLDLGLGAADPASDATTTPASRSTTPNSKNSRSGRKNFSKNPYGLEGNIVKMEAGDEKSASTENSYGQLEAKFDSAGAVSGVIESKSSEDTPADSSQQLAVCSSEPMDLEGGTDVQEVAVKAESLVEDSSKVARRIIPCGDNLPKLSEDTEDVDDVQECEHFDTRQSFLNLCQGNHYQFDQLRRAKHTSMMVLYHLHNPDAPKFVPSCTHCHIDILAGYRHHCESCEVDFCHSCFTVAGPRIHQHPLRAINMSSSAPVQLTEEQRKERQRSIQLHMQLLSHAANCAKCDSKNCLRMKDFLKHDSTCTTKVTGGCRLCARISNLLNIHARSCRVDGCKVPHCLDMREQIRKLTLRQQQMDDRRRVKMNVEYNRGSAPVPGADNSDD